MVMKMPFFWAFGKILPCRVENDWSDFPAVEGEELDARDVIEDGVQMGFCGDMLRRMYYGCGFLVPGVIIENVRIPFFALLFFGFNSK